MQQLGPTKTVFSPEDDSIFGNTHQGVPNPNVPHRHPWPTRYHGPNWTVPGVQSTYRERPYAKPPFTGMGAAPFVEAVGSNVTGNPWLDAALGGVMGYAASPDGSSKGMWAAAGSVAAYGFGLAGFAGVGAMLFMAHWDR